MRIKTSELIVGETYTAYEQGTNITPHEVEVKVVWFSDTTVWYRKVGEVETHETPLERFKEIVRIK